LHERAIPPVASKQLFIDEHGELRGADRRHWEEKALATTDAQEEDMSVRWALEDLESLAEKGGFATDDVVALLKVMNVYDVLDYLDAKMSNRLQ
jgi:hypothetical protein